MIRRLRTKRSQLQSQLMDCQLPWRTPCSRAQRTPCAQCCSSVVLHCFRSSNWTKLPQFNAASRAQEPPSSSLMARMQENRHHIPVSAGHTLYQILYPTRLVLDFRNDAMDTLAACEESLATLYIRAASRASFSSIASHSITITETDKILH